MNYSAIQNVAITIVKTLLLVCITALAIAGETTDSKKILALVDSALLPRLYNGNIPKAVMACPELERAQLAIALAFRADLIAQGLRIPTKKDKDLPRLAIPSAKLPDIWPKNERGEVAAFADALSMALGTVVSDGGRIDTALPGFGRIRIRLERAVKSNSSLWAGVSQDTLDFLQPAGTALQQQWLAIVKDGNFSDRTALEAAATLTGDEDVFPLIADYGLDPVKHLYFSKWTLIDRHGDKIAAALKLQDQAQQAALLAAKVTSNEKAPKKNQGNAEISPIALPSGFEDALETYASLSTDYMRYICGVMAWSSKVPKSASAPRLSPKVPEGFSQLTKLHAQPNDWSLHLQASYCWYSIALRLSNDGQKADSPEYRDAIEKGLAAEREVIRTLGKTYSPAYYPSEHLNRESKLQYSLNFSRVFHYREPDRLCSTKPMADFFSESGNGPMSQQVMRTVWSPGQIMYKIRVGDQDKLKIISEMHSPKSHFPGLRDAMLTRLLGRSPPHHDHAWLAKLARDYAGDPLASDAQRFLKKEVNGTMMDDEVRRAP